MNARTDRNKLRYAAMVAALLVSFVLAACGGTVDPATGRGTYTDEQNIVHYFAPQQGEWYELTQGQYGPGTGSCIKFQKDGSKVSSVTQPCSELGYKSVPAVTNTTGTPLANPTATTGTQSPPPNGTNPGGATQNTDWQTAHFGRLERLDPSFRNGGWQAWLAAAGVTCDSVRDARQPEEETSPKGKISVSGLQVEAKGCKVMWPNVVTTDVPTRIVSKEANAFQYQPDPTNGSTLYTNVTATGPVTIYASGFSWGQFTQKFGMTDTGGTTPSAAPASAAPSSAPSAAPASKDKCYTVAEIDQKFGIDRNAQGAQNGLLVENGQTVGATIKLTADQVKQLEAEGWTIQGSNPVTKSAWSPQSCRPLKAQ